MTSAADTDESVKRPLLDGRYELIAEIGRGGSSVVYRARDTVLSADVAVKIFVIAPESSRGVEREAMVMFSVAHPHIIRAHGFGHATFDDRECPYLVLDLLDGASLDRVNVSALDPPTKLRIGSELADALAFLHEKGIAHCDLKPSNVFLTACGRTVLLDFGIARAVAPDRSLAASRMLPGGTLRYVPPEALTGDEPGPAADVWAWGLVVLELFSGRPAGDGPLPPTPQDVQRCLAQLRKRAPQHVLQIVSAALSANPRQRPRDGAALRSGLTERPAGRRSRPFKRNDRFTIRASLVPIFVSLVLLVAAAAVPYASLVVEAALSRGRLDRLVIRDLAGFESFPDAAARAGLQSIEIRAFLERVVAARQEMAALVLVRNGYTAYPESTPTKTLEAAVNHGMSRVVAELLRRENFPSDVLATSLSTAIYKRHWSTVRAFIERGHREYCLWSLFGPKSQCDVEFFRALLAAGGAVTDRVGACPGIRREPLLTYLLDACDEVVELLLQHPSALPTIRRTSDGVPLLNLTPWVSSSSTVDLFFRYGFRGDQRSKGGLTFAHSVIVSPSSSVSMLRAAISAPGFDARRVGFDGTPLHSAVRENWLDATAMLAPLGALDVRDGSGRTPLHLAARKDLRKPFAQSSHAVLELPILDSDLVSASLLTLLFAAGSSSDARASDGKTPLDYIAESGCVECLAVAAASRAVR